jgi:hypothetical protein
MTVFSRRILCVGPILVCALVAISGCHDPEQARGRKLFVGDLPLAGRIAGHSEILPEIATRCVNCHTVNGAAASTPTNAFGTGLSAASLQSSMPRRGGPPSRFDQATMCRLLRTGIDPASIIVPRSMPLYDATDEECHALWSYLTRA